MLKGPRTKAHNKEGTHCAHPKDRLDSVRVAVQGEVARLCQRTNSKHALPKGVIVVEQGTVTLSGNVLVGGMPARQGRIHLHVMTGEVQGNQDLTQEEQARIQLRQVHNQATGRCPIGDHVKDCAKATRYIAKYNELEVFEVKYID